MPMKHGKQPKRPVRVEYSAGGIVFRRSVAGQPPRIEIGFIQDPYYKWTFPKGHIKPGEEVIAAAIRETSEEMGLVHLAPVVPLPTLDIWFVDRFVHKGMLIHKFITLVLMETPADAKANPQKSEKIRAVRWVPVTRALSFSSYANTRQALLGAIKLLSERFGFPMPKMNFHRKKKNNGRKELVSLKK